jgi:hypothetical protein
MPKKTNKEKKTIVIYKPIEAIESKDNFPNDRIDGHDDYWNMYETRRKEIDRWGEKLGSYMKRKHSKTHKIRIVQHCRSTIKVLQGLTANDVVYIHSHGNSEKVGLRPYGLDHAELASRLESDGLPKENTPRLKFWSCHSGDPIPGQPDSTLAKEVGFKLKKLGYGKFTTFGYRGKILAVKRVNQKSKQVQDSNDSTVIERARSRRVRNDF